MTKQNKNFLESTSFWLFSGLTWWWHVEVPRQGIQPVELELQLPAYVTATTTGIRAACDLHHSTWQHRILNPPGEARG